MENPEFVELLYDRNFPILTLDTPHDYSRSVLDSSSDVSVSQMSNFVVCASFLSCTEYN